MRLKSKVLCAAILLVATSAHAELRRDEGIGFYIGLDTLSTIASGTYRGASNPNKGRITMLLEHGNHYHSIGAYALSGPASLPVVMDTNANNQIPEISSLEAPLPLTPGSGLYAGTWRSNVGSSEYSYLGMGSTASLTGFDVDALETTLFNSSAGRWTGSLAGVEIGLQLISYTLGLKVGTETDMDVFDGGDIYSLGDGASIEFKPVFWVAEGSPMATYTAGFRLVDLSNNAEIMDSGRFYINFAPVPEPETYALFGVGLVLMGAALRRRVR